MNDIITAITTEEGWSDGSLNEQARLRIYIPEKGKSGFPRWLGRLLEKEPDGGHRRRALFDHERHIGNIAFAEPYGAEDDDFAALLTFCAKHNLRFTVKGLSHHYPSKTFRIVIWRPQDEKELSNVNYWHSTSRELAAAIEKRKKQAASAA